MAIDRQSPSPWKNEAILEAARQGWCDKAESAANLAAQLNRDFQRELVAIGAYPLTRNAIVGIAHRKRWTQGSSQVTRKGPGRPRGPRQRPSAPLALPPPARPTRPPHPGNVVRRQDRSADPGLPSPASRAEAQVQAAQVRAQLAAPQPPSTGEEVDVVAIRNGQCKFGIGHDPENEARHFFCAAATASPATPYCAWHEAMVYAPAAPRQRRNATRHWRGGGKTELLDEEAA